jgi:hypothetical protein
LVPVPAFAHQILFLLTYSMNTKGQTPSPSTFSLASPISSAFLYRSIYKNSLSPSFNVPSKNFRIDDFSNQKMINSRFFAEATKWGHCGIGQTKNKFGVSNRRRGHTEGQHFGGGIHHRQNNKGTINNKGIFIGKAYCINN